MRIVKKEFTVYNFDELNDAAKEKALSWSGDSLALEAHMDSAAFHATNDAEEWILDKLHDKNSKVRIYWDTCSAGFVRNLEVEVNDEPAGYDDEFMQRIGNLIQGTLDWWNDEDNIQEYLVENEYEFTKYGKFYRD